MASLASRQGRIDRQTARGTRSAAILTKNSYTETLLWCSKGDIVLDPFSGTGTTGAVAKKLGRNFIGIEKESEYIAIAEKRINAINALLPEADLELAQ